MSTTTKHLLSAVATVAFAIAATATTVTNAFAQPPSYPTTAKPAPTAGSSSAESSSAPAGKTAEPAGKTRAQVQAEYLEARKNGTLIETEADMDVAQTRKHGLK